jgi:alpha-L-rhamnosidase
VNHAGWPSIKLRGAAGAVVRMTPGELLTRTGNVSQGSSGGGPSYWTFTLKGYVVVG